MMEQTTTEEAADAREVMAKITPLLDTHDINEISMDIHLAGNWNPDNGGSDFLFNYGIDGFSRFEFSTNNLLPSYEDLMTVLPEDLAEFDEDIFDETWAEVFGQGKLTATLIDEGGLERSFVIAKDFAQLVDHNDPPMGFLKSAKPDQVRQMVAGSVLMAAPEVEKNFPPAVAYLQAFSDYMSKGGTIRFIMDPGKVLTGDDFEAVVEKTGEDPEKIIKELGISVVHDLAE
jgi:hypothetical protein